MTDNVLTHLVQFGAITAAAMGLTEWKVLGFLPGKKKKRPTMLVYTFGLAALAFESGFITMPLADDRLHAYLGILLLSIVSVFASLILVEGKKGLQAMLQKGKEKRQ